MEQSFMAMFSCQLSGDISDCAFSGNPVWPTVGRRIYSITAVICDANNGRTL